MIFNLKRMCNIINVKLNLHNRLFAHKIVLEILNLKHSYSVLVYKTIGFTTMGRSWMMVSYDIKIFYYADHIIIGKEYDYTVFNFYSFTLLLINIRYNYLFKNNNLFIYTNTYTYNRCVT